MGGLHSPGEPFLMPPADASLNQPGATGETGLHEAGIDWAARDRYRMLSVTFNVFIEDVAMARSIRWLLEPFRVPFGNATYSVEISALERDGVTERPLYRCLIGGKARVESWDGRDLSRRPRFSRRLRRAASGFRTPMFCTSRSLAAKTSSELRKAPGASPSGTPSGLYGTLDPRSP